ncbi:MAG: ABC transporter substrate-binding protein [Bifidobacteriaceae bacterium]|jgi:polar amino acid transport system substrate-binding protein|nr:ABC transporter substrate-binding protein [Bifidobacteriaceae bacterium]
MNRNLTRRPTTALSAGLVVLTAISVTLAGCSQSADDTPDTTKSQDVETSPGAEAPTPFDLLPDDIKESKTINLGTHADSPPCEYMDDGNIAGIGYDMWEGVAAELGVTIEPTSIEFAGLIPGVESGRFDVAEQCIADTLEREEVITFVDWVYNQSVVVTTADNPKNISTDPLSLCGLTVAVQTGTNYLSYVTDKFNPTCVAAGQPELVIQQLDSQSQALINMQSKRVDFAMTNAAAGAYLAEGSDVELELFPNELLPRNIMGFAFQKDSARSQQLVDAWVAALQEMHKDGTYQEILAKWGMSDYLLEPGVNLVGAAASASPSPSATP